jgi:adenosylcobinamide-GDP ribazoletransferase
LSYNRAMSANDAHDPLSDGPPAGAPGGAPGDALGQLDLLRVALGFLSRLPVGHDEGPGDGFGDGRALPADALARAMPLFPLAGAILGALGAALLLVAGWLGVPAPVAAVAALGALVWLTGALHEDGLADVADGFGGGADRDERLAIMRDSRTGNFGALALVVAFVLKAAALAAIAADGAWLAAAALLAAATWSRAMFAPLMRWLPPARADGVAALAGMPTGADMWRGLALGAALALLVTLSGGGIGAVVALAAGGAAAFVVGWLALDRIGGYTGDVLGAAQQACEVLTLVAFSAILTGMA